MNASHGGGPHPNAIVTGATSGIGFEIAQGLVAQGVHVGIVARNPTKAKAAVERLGADPKNVIDVFRADLAELAEVRRAAADIHDRWDGVDVLVNNAGINSLGAGTTAEGFDAMVATNYLGPFLLTNLLHDRLGGGRVVNIASEAHRLSDRLDPDTFERPNRSLAGNRLYGRTKLALMLFTQEAAVRWAGDGITVNSCCPGLVATNLAGDTSPITRAAGLLSRTPLVRRPEQGAAIAVKLATDPSMGSVTGRFFTSTPGATLLPPVPALQDADLQERLWARTASLVGLPS